MPHTYTKLLFHIVFSTKERFGFITDDKRSRIYEYIGGTIRGLGGICIEIGGVEDHVHILVALKPTVTGWAREHVHPKFEWQNGYGAFTVGESQVEAVRTYIRGQKEHHRKMVFDEEFKELLNRANIKYQEQFLWK